MLRALDIRDILLIDHLELSFEAGLNVLTGETGAGKSILLDSLGFVLGWRGRAELVRAGAQQGEVSAVFELPEGHAALTVLEQAGIPQSRELILRRINTVDGRKSAWVNDRRCSGEVLRALSEHLVELHGQNDDRGLLNPRGHRSLLDEFAGLAPKLAELRGLWRAKAEAARALSTAQAAVMALRAEEEYLRYAVAELDALAPQAGEDAELDAQRRQMQSADKLRGDLDRALSGLRDEKGAEDSAAKALRWLESAGGEVGEMLTEAVDALERGLNELALAADGVEQTLRAMEFSPADLEACEERLFAIRGLARKYEVLPDALATHADALRQKLEAVDASDAQLGALEAQSAAAEAAYQAAAEALTQARHVAAAQLDTAVMAELAPLKMERAVFTTEVSAGEAGPEGQDAVSFVVATNPGAPAGPLAKIASGGELSRFLLALKVCLTGGNSDVTLIFDEIDRGVGGATADAVGRRLRALGEGGQVLVVTHSPQVAALGQHHWRVEKTVKAGQTLSTVKPLDRHARVDEVARMISGDSITEEARAAARALL